VLSIFDEIPVCVAYRLPDGETVREFPCHQSDFHHAEPVLETLPGWAEPLDGAESIADLPEAARSYIAFVEQELEVPVALVGTGQERERVLYGEASGALL
jgi:adenylosuccinate synthase